MESGNALDEGPHPLSHRLGVNPSHQSARLRLVCWVGAQEAERPQHVFKPAFVRYGATPFHHRPRVEDGVDARAERRAKAAIFCPPDVHRSEGLRSSLHQPLPLAVRHCDERRFVPHLAAERSCSASSDGAEGDEARKRQPRRWRAGGSGWGAGRRAATRRCRRQRWCVLAASPPWLEGFICVSPCSTFSFSAGRAFAVFLSECSHEVASCFFFRLSLTLSTTGTSTDQQKKDGFSSCQ